MKSRTSSPQRKLGVALVGLGSLSQNQIAPALLKTKQCRLTALVSGSAPTMSTLAARYKISASSCYTYDDFDRIAENPDVDFVFIVLPNSMHAEFTARAARAGKHVLCEKPMANSVKECRAMIAGCERAGVQLAIAYRCQFEPHHVEAMRLAREKVFGEIKFIEASFGFRIGDAGQWRLKKSLAGGGALMDVGIYVVQAARYITGEEPQWLFATEAKTDRAKFKEVDETICWTMKFPSGVIANCSTNYVVNGIDRCWVGAERGWFELNPAFNYTRIEGRTCEGPMRLPQTDHFALELDDFARCIVEKRPSRVSGAEGLADMKVIEAIYKSIERGRPVTLR
jgi:predicted dehydrogenase